MKREVQFRDLGVLDYQTVWDLQHDLFQQTIDTKIHNRRNQTKSPTTNHFLLVEHNPVITLGKSGSADHLLTSKAELEAQGISFFKIDRGGDITYHGPGQIVGYPILDLDHQLQKVQEVLYEPYEVCSFRGLSSFLNYHGQPLKKRIHLEILQHLQF